MIRIGGISRTRVNLSMNMKVLFSVGEVIAFAVSRTGLAT